MASQPTWVERGCNQVRALCSSAVAPWLCGSQRRLHSVPWFDYSKVFTWHTIAGHHMDCLNDCHKASLSSCEQPKRGEMYVFPVKNYIIFIATELGMWTREGMGYRWGEQFLLHKPQIHCLFLSPVCKEFLQPAFRWMCDPSTVFHINCPSSVPFPR